MTDPVERHGSCIRLRPEMREEYLRLHAAVWPEVEQTLRAAGIRSYVIFLHDDLLFSYYEYTGADHAAAQAQIAADPATQRWWALTAPCQERLPGTPDGDQWLPLPEVWHLPSAKGDDPLESPRPRKNTPERAMPAAERTPVLDAHVHLWDTERLRYPWLDEVPLPRRVDAAALRAAADPVAEFVLVQADCVAEQALAEIAWLSEQAGLLGGVRGIVGYAPLHDPVAAAEHLAELRRFPLVVGVRRLIQDEPPGFCTRPGLRAGVALLAAEDLVFDLCVREPQLAEVVDLVRATPEVRFVLDHLGKPRVGADATHWRRDLRALAALPNVVAKLSGLLTEVVPASGAGDVRPYLEYALSVFGPGRCLFGSDWPVLTSAGTYPEWRDTVLDSLAGLSEAETEAVLHGNARAVYRPRRLAARAVDPANAEAIR